MGPQALAHLQALNTAVPNVAALDQAFAQHPDAAIITRFRDWTPCSEPAIPGEIGDDRTRFADAKALQAFAGTAPVTVLRLPIHYLTGCTERSFASHRPPEVVS